jgi:hypothetical protein
MGGLRSSGKPQKTAPTIGEVETEIAEASADQPAASEAEPAPQLAPAAIEPAATDAAPSTLQASLIARIDRLSAVKEVAQTAAVIGREFSDALIEAVSPVSKGALAHALEQLVEAGLVFRRGQSPDATYTFKHALVQDAAYATLLRGPRQALHARVADALEQLSPDVVERQPELLAHHLTAARATKRAVEYWFRAGERAASRSANREAAAHYRVGLQLLEHFADLAEREAWELRLSIALGPVLMMTTTSTGPEVRGVYARASQLARQAGQSVELFRALWGSWLAAVAAADSRSAGAFLDELFALAQQDASEEMALQAHHAGWTTTFFLRGDFLVRAAAHRSGPPALSARDACAPRSALWRPRSGRLRLRRRRDDFGPSRASRSCLAGSG